MLIEFSSAYAEIILLQPIQTRVFFLFPRTCKGYPLLTKVCVISVVFSPYFWELSCLGERNLTDHCLSPRARWLSLRQRGHRSSSIPFSSCVRGLSAHSTTALNWNFIFPRMRELSIRLVIEYTFKTVFPPCIRGYPCSAELKAIWNSVPVHTGVILFDRLGEQTWEDFPLMREFSICQYDVHFFWYALPLMRELSYATRTASSIIAPLLLQWLSSR